LSQLRLRIRPQYPFAIPFGKSLIHVDVLAWPCRFIIVNSIPGPKKVEYRLGTTSASDEDDNACASGDDEKDDDICKDDLAKEMAEIRELRTRIRSLESELKQRLKGLRERANRGKANRSQIVRFINEIEGMIIVLSAPSK